MFGKIRPFIFKFDPETAHNLAIQALKFNLMPRNQKQNFKHIETEIFNKKIPNPIGLAAGFDKDAEVYNSIFRLGFGFVEVGTITPLKQSGNPKPRVFRLEEDEALINRLGFNNSGSDKVRSRILSSPPTGLLGINIGPNKDTKDRVKDFLSRAWLPIFVLGWNATAFALQTVRALMLDENDKLYVMAARARGISGMSLLWRYPAKHSLGPVINSIGFDLNRIFSALPIVALILILTEAGALLIEALARSNDQQLAGAIIFLLTATIVFVNFITDIILAIIDPRIRKGVMGGG